MISVCMRVCVNDKGLFKKNLGSAQFVLWIMALRGQRWPWKCNPPRNVYIEILRTATFVLTVCPFWNVEIALTQKDILLQSRHLCLSLTVEGNFRSEAWNDLPPAFSLRQFSFILKLCKSHFLLTTESISCVIKVAKVIL